MILPLSSRNGAARARNQRCSPSARRKRVSTSIGSPLVNDARQLRTCRSRSSGWTQTFQPEPCPSFSERPEYSEKRFPINTFDPSGMTVTVMAGWFKIFTKFALTFAQQFFNNFAVRDIAHQTQKPTSVLLELPNANLDRKGGSVLAPVASSRK